jgi:hypothetical protein
MQAEHTQLNAAALLQGKGREMMKFEIKHALTV